MSLVDLHPAKEKVLLAGVESSQLDLVLLRITRLIHTMATKTITGHHICLERCDALSYYLFDFLPTICFLLFFDTLPIFYADRFLSLII